MFDIDFLRDAQLELRGNIFSKDASKFELCTLTFHAGFKPVAGAEFMCEPLAPGQIERVLYLPNLGRNRLYLDALMRSELLFSQGCARIFTTVCTRTTVV